MFYVPFAGGDLTFTIEVPNDLYEVYTNQDSKQSIKTGWSAKINLIIWDRLNLPCCFSFKRARYRQQDIISSGICKQKKCRATLETTLPHCTNNLNVTIQEYKPRIKHDSKIKRRVLPEIKSELVDKLQQKSAYALRSELADRTMKESCSEPAHLPSLNALRIIKSRSQCPIEQQNPVIALHELKSIFINCIQDIGYDPFFVFYATDTQKAWYKEETSNKRAVVSIDASGIGVQSPTDNKKYILLYVICAHGNNIFFF